MSAEYKLILELIGLKNSYQFFIAVLKLLYLYLLKLSHAWFLLLLIMPPLVSYQKKQNNNPTIATEAMKQRATIATIGTVSALFSLNWNYSSFAFPLTSPCLFLFINKGRERRFCIQPIPSVVLLVVAYIIAYFLSN